jgi:hypothetical protein
MQRLSRARTAEAVPDGAAGLTAPAAQEQPGAAPAPAAVPARAPAATGGPPARAADRGAARPQPERGALPPGFDLATADPLHAYLLGQAGAVDITRLEFSSPALAALREAGVVLVVHRATGSLARWPASAPGTWRCSTSRSAAG